MCEVENKTREILGYSDNKDKEILALPVPQLSNPNIAVITPRTMYNGKCFLCDYEKSYATPNLAYSDLNQHFVGHHQIKSSLKA